MLTNPVYYGGLVWHRGAEDEAINWEATHPAPWTREDFDRRAAVRSERATGAAPRQRGRPHANHALAGLALCGKCLSNGRYSVMRPITSSYRRQDGSRGRTYVCGHVQDATGLCDAPRIDAELIDTHVVNELQRYLGDFEAWRDQLTSGYASERQRLERELATAVDSCEEQERPAIGLIASAQSPPPTPRPRLRFASPPRLMKNWNAVVAASMRPNAR